MTNKIKEGELVKIARNLHRDVLKKTKKMYDTEEKAVRATVAVSVILNEIEKDALKQTYSEEAYQDLLEYIKHVREIIRDTDIPEEIKESMEKPTKTQDYIG